MKILFYFFLYLFCIGSAFGQEQASIVNEYVLHSTFGTPPEQKLSLHNPLYLIAGDEDLKLQFSFKYRMAKKIPLYFAYSQVMFWDVYENSKPFSDINFKPEFFYRLFRSESHMFRTLDFGYYHNSNGKGGTDSRSFDRVFVRGNYLHKFGRHYFDANLSVFKTFDEDSTNADIVNHYGYWELIIYFSNLINVNEQSLNLEFKTYAGREVFDFNQGAYQVGLVYDFHTENFNPSLYFQYFDGYGEKLIGYNQKTTEYRLGLILTF